MIERKYLDRRKYPTEKVKKIRREKMLGENNPRWAGGVSEYPNHSLFKKRRIEKLKIASGLCEICKKKATQIHHINENKSDHRLSNLLAVCFSCHRVLHPRNKSKTSKYIRLYGMTLDEMANKFGGNVATYYYRHKTGKLGIFLEENAQ